MACDMKLKEKKWPLDCFVLLQVNSTKKLDKKYINLDQWCKIYAPELLNQPPPKALFTLYMPKNCLHISLKAQAYFNSQSVLNSTFLNSFL